jgi:hypothetical protein
MQTSSADLNRLPAAADRANAARCHDRPGTYEAWYVTVNDRQGRGYWIRITTLNPATGVSVEPHSALWAFAFDRNDPRANWGAKVLFPLRDVRIESQPFAIRLGGATLTRDGCSGEFQSDRGKARWDLRWTSREPPFAFLRPRWQGLSSVANVGVQPALSISGTIDINGRTYRLEHATGGQQHTWGTSHALAWNWGFASGPDFWVDGATSRVRSRLGRVLAGTAVGAGAAEHRFLFDHPLRVLRNRGPISPDRWDAHARIGDRDLTVSVRPRREDLIGVTYADPHGGSRFCYHTEVADLDLQLTDRNRTITHIRQPGAAAFEYASEVPLPGLPPLF